MIFLFDIIFQSGEFYDNWVFSLTDIIPEVAGGIIGGLIGVWSAVLIFNRTIKKDREKEQEKQKSFEIDKLKYLALLLTNSIKTIENLIKGMDGFREEIQKDSIRFPLLETASIHDLERIVTRINQEEHYHAYLNQLKSEEIGTIFMLIDYFYDSYKLFWSLIEKAQKYDYELKKDFTDIEREIRESLSAGIYKLNGSEYQNSDIHIKLNDILLSYLQYLESQTGETNLEMIQKKLIKPILPVYLEYGDIDLPFDFREIGQKAGRANKMLHPVKMHSEDTDKKVGRYVEDFKKHLSRLKECSELINFFVLQKKLPSNSLR